MAKMYPKEIYPRAQRGEKEVYEALREELPDNWVVFHNREIEYQDGRLHVHYEADFVVLIPYQGVLVIEVKDWPFVELRDGDWYFKGHNPDEEWKKFTKKSPLYQANEAARKLFRSLRRTGILPEADADCPKLRSLAIMTKAVPPDLGAAGAADQDISRTTSLPLDTLYVCGRRALHTKLRDRIMTIFKGDQKGRGEHMSSVMMQRLTQYLAPTTVLHLDLSAYLAEMEHAAANLFQWLPMLSGSKGDIRVDGCAGSGKTVMACHEAARLAATLPRDGEHRVLMLCYNLHLADFLREQPEVAAQADIITACNFHTFCTEHLLRATGHADVLPPEEVGNALTPEVLARLRTLLPELPHYDYIFVDEAQDFHSEWWDIIHGLQKEGGRTFLFVDEHQDIYHRSGSLPEPAVRLRLSHNLRNTAEIADYTAGMIPHAPLHPLNLHGAAIEIAPPADSPQERAEHIRAYIRRLRESSPIELGNSDIAVLTPWRPTRETSSLPHVGGLDYAADGETPEEKHTRYLRWRRAENPTILGETIKAFKGLEAAYIIVTDIPGEEESRGFSLPDFYTACSRAKYGLYLVPTTKGHELAQRFLCTPANTPEEPS